MDAVEAARAEVRGWLPRLGSLVDAVKVVHVTVESVQEGRQQRLYRARMKMVFADATDLSVAHEHPSNQSHEDLYVAIRNVFRAARRQLEDHLRAMPLAPQIENESPSEISGRETQPKEQ